MIEDTVSGKAKNTINTLMGHLESHPIITIKSASQATGKSFNAISNAIGTLEDMGVLRQVKGKRVTVSTHLRITLRYLGMEPTYQCRWYCEGQT